MQVTDSPEVFEGELGSYWFDEDGILNSISNTTKRTVQNIKGNVELVKQITHNRKVCLLVHVKPSPVPDKETRALVSQELPKIYKAMAMVSRSGLGKVIMNFLFRLNPPVIPMKSFTSEEEARAWLKGYM